MILKVVSKLNSMGLVIAAIKTQDGKQIHSSSMGISGLKYHIQRYEQLGYTIKYYI